MSQQFSIQQVADKSGHPRTLVTRWIDEGLLPHVSIPGSKVRRVREEDFYRFMQENNLPIYEEPDAEKQRVGKPVEIDGVMYRIIKNLYNGGRLVLERTVNP